MGLRNNVIIIATVLVCGLFGALFLSQLRQENLVVSGILEADEARIGSRLGGRVAAVHVKEGDRVVAGEVLVELEPFTLPARLEEARAVREQTKVNFEKFTRGPRTEELDVARARLEQARAEQRLAEQSLKRQGRLLVEKSTSQQLYDEALRTQEAALARVKELEAEVKELEVGFRREDIDKAEAEYNAANARVSALERELEELTIQAPISGVVSALQLVKGDLVAATAPVLTIIDDTQYWVRCYLPENALWVKSEQKVSIRFDPLPNESFTGTVGFISPRAEFSPTNVQTSEERAKQMFRVKVFVQGNTERLRPGMHADVDFGTSAYSVSSTRDG